MVATARAAEGGVLSSAAAACSAAVADFACRVVPSVWYLNCCKHDCRRGQCNTTLLHSRKAPARCISQQLLCLEELHSCCNCTPVDYTTTTSFVHLSCFVPCYFPYLKGSIVLKNRIPCNPTIALALHLDRAMVLAYGEFVSKPG